MFPRRSLLAALVRLRGFLLASAFLGAALGAPSSHALGIQAWRELKYGMFIHYGMSTFDGEELSDGKTPVDRFRPTAQDVDQWIRVAKSAGMKYAVLTAKHVAGFCLWDSKVNWKGAEFAYDVGASPVKTDIVAEFMKACAKHGIVPGIYYCSMDRRHSHPEVEWTPTLPFISEEYFQLMQDHLTELHTRYPGIAIQWIDIPRHLTPAQRTTLYDQVRSLNPACLVEFNYGTESRDIPGDYTMEVAAKVTLPTDILNSEITAIKQPFRVRQTYQGKIYELGYEHCVSMASGWFWKAGTSAKSLSSLSGQYKAVQALNGNLLLNVPPDQTGRIPEAFVRRLNEVRDELRLDTAITPTGLMHLPGRQGPFQPGRATWKVYNSLGRKLPLPAIEGGGDAARAAVRVKGRSEVRP